jgi:hypothetical protein
MNQIVESDQWQQAISSGMGPVLQQEPLASIDSNGQVWPHEVGTEIDPTRAYVFTQADLQAAVDRMNRGPGIKTDALPDLHNGQEPQAQMTEREQLAANAAAKRQAAAMTMQMRDGAGLRIPGV